MKSSISFTVVGGRWSVVETTLVIHVIGGIY